MKGKVLSLTTILACFLAFASSHSSIGQAEQLPAAALRCEALLAPNSLDSFNFKDSYLNLLKLVIEAIDEISTIEFPNLDRTKIKFQLLDKISKSEGSINPLDFLKELERSVDLVQHSALLSALDESGQITFTIEHLSSNEWEQVRLYAEELGKRQQNTIVAQAEAKPSTEDDFKEVPDLTGENRLFKLIRSKSYEKAFDLVKRPFVTTRCLNQVNERENTALDILLLTADQSLESVQILLKEMQLKNAVDSNVLQSIDSRFFLAIHLDNTKDLERFYELGARLKNHSLLLGQAVINNRPKALRFLLNTVVKSEDVSEVSQKFFLDCLRSRVQSSRDRLPASLEMFQVLVDYFDPSQPLKNSSTLFEEATLIGQYDVINLLAERGVPILPRYEQLFRRFIKNGRFALAEGLITTLNQLNVPLDVKSADGTTLMHDLMRLPQIPEAIINKLCVLGISFDSRDENGRTPLDYNYLPARATIAQRATRQAVEDCLLIRRHFSSVDPRQVFYVAYFDFLDKMLQEVDRLPRKAYKPADRIQLKAKILQSLINNYLDLRVVSSEFTPTLSKTFAYSLRLLNELTLYQRKIILDEVRQKLASILEKAQELEKKGPSILHRLIHNRFAQRTWRPK